MNIVARYRLGVSAVCALLAVTCSLADDALEQEVRADLARQRFGVTGAGVIVAILDRGIDYRHPDFRNADGTTRIRWLLDMTGQVVCDAGNPPPVEYDEDDINAALFGGPDLPTRDAVGHGTVTAGVAAGNGLAAAGGKYRGLAGGADLIIVKLVSEGAPAHDDQPAEVPFQGCTDQALDWLDGKIDQLGKPCVALINAGVQWGPMDGTSAISRKIDEVFGLDRPGRVFVAPSGDEGGLPTHAGGEYSQAAATEVRYDKQGAGSAYLSMWYTGGQPASLTIASDDGTVVGPVGPGEWRDEAGIYVIQYEPGNAFYPWTSSGPDRAIWIRMTGHPGPGSILVQGTQPGTGRFDLYHADIPAQVTFSNHLVPGRLQDAATTYAAVVAGASVLRDSYIDIDGIQRFVGDEGAPGEIWALSSAGPTRDGRGIGVDLAPPGHNVFAAYGTESYWATFRFNLIEDGDGYYGRHGATSGAAPVAVGAIALMLELDPNLTARAAREILRQTARSDAQTGSTPNVDWGYGKLDVYAALLAVAGIRPGDLNCDDSFDGADIDPFFLALGDPAAYLQQFPDCDALRGDMNADGGLDGADIDAFFACLGGNCP